MWIPTPWMFVTWICTVKGWVVLQTLIMCIEYFVACWVLRRIIWPVIATLFENIVSYNILINIFPDLLPEAIKWLKRTFYLCLGYFCIGICGMVGAIASIQLMLWAYAIYLLITWYGWCGNAYGLYQVLMTLLGIEDKLNDVCSKVADIVNLGNCDSFFDQVKQWTYIIIIVVLLLEASTLICTCILLRRNYLATGFLVTSLFSGPEEIARRKEKMEKRKEKEEGNEDADEKKENALAKSAKGSTKYRRRVVAEVSKHDPSGDEFVLSRYAQRETKLETRNSIAKMKSTRTQIPLPRGRYRRARLVRQYSDDIQADPPSYDLV